MLAPIPVVTCNFGGRAFSGDPGGWFLHSDFNLRGGGLKLTLAFALAVTLLKFAIIESELFRAGDFATGQIKRACYTAAVFVSRSGNTFADLTLLLRSPGRRNNAESSPARPFWRLAMRLCS
tara:strand:- start:111 stop:476 length:366 start_codon:yes stop_codon:yes gene_type:complete